MMDTQTPFEASYEHGRYVEICQGEYALFRSDTATIEDIQRVNAFVDAINNTVIAGIEPTSVPLILEALKGLMEAHRNSFGLDAAWDEELVKARRALEEAGHINTNTNEG